MNNYSRIIKSLGKRRVKQKELLSEHTTFKIGGTADLFYVAKTTVELVKAVKLARKYRVAFFILGGGSNILVSDSGFRGLVIRVNCQVIKTRGHQILVEAGLPLTDLVNKTAASGLTGLEFLAGIPGTVGGAVRGNAGAWGQYVGGKISKIKILNEKNKIQWLTPKDCYFRYRQSRFKKNREVILAVRFKLKKERKAKIENLIKNYLAKRKKDPSEPSAGCIFLNPLPKIAWELIEQANLRGKQIDQAQISPQHANFIINLGQAKAEDVLQLIKLAKGKVKKKFGVTLKEEIQYVGFD